MGIDSTNRFVVSDCFGSGRQTRDEQVDLVSQTYSFAMPSDSRRGTPLNQSGLQHEQQMGRRILPEVYPSFEPHRMLNRNGSEITFDQFDRVTAMRDAANRNFEFKYDDNGELNQVKNEYGIWRRHKETDEWNSDNGGKWRGEIEVNAQGYSYTNCDPRGSGDRTIYRPDGSKAIETLGPNGEVFSRHREDRNGNIADEDFRQGRIKYTMNNGRRADRDLNNNSVVVFDAEGRLTAMRDAAGKKFNFSDFDDRGRPQAIRDERGSWTRHGQDRWINNATGKSWLGDVEIDKSGLYSYTDYASGNIRKITHSRDGNTAISDRGIVTTVDKDGHKVDSFIDGDKVQDGTKSAVQFKVVKGETTAGILNFTAAPGEPGAKAEKVKAEIVHDKDDVHAIIHTKPDSAVRAMQEGRVVYSFNHNDKNNRAGNSQYNLGSADLAMLDRYRRNNPEQDLVVMACYDKQAHGTRYQIYGGLDLASTKTGDTIKAGDVIGRAGDQGYTYAARRQKLTGKSVELMIQGQKI